MLPTDVLESLINNLNTVQSVNYTLVALITVLVYDTILTMPREIKFVWKTGGVSLRKVLYIVCRYYALSSLAVIVEMSIGSTLGIERQTSHQFKGDPTDYVYSCRIYANWFTGSSLQVEEALVNFLLILRINALYGGDKKVLFFILALYLIELVTFFYCGARVAHEVTLTPLPGGLSLSGCLVYIIALPNLSFTLLAWISALAFSAVLLSFSAYKARQDLAPVASGSWRLTWLNLHHPLLLAIFQQGVIFYIVNTVINLLNAALVTRIHTVLDTIALPAGIVAYSICGCHFLLNFHELSDNVLYNVGNTDAVVVFRNDTTNEAYMLNTM